MALYPSIPINTPCEMINVTPLNPLISKCQIKVCYVGDEPNRNNSIITKEVAKQMANSLPGSPIVGYYNNETQDFEEHNKTLEIKNGKIVFKDTTQPYGFIDLNAKVWFQKFLENGIEREYLVTEGYLWTGQYPECQRIIDKGDNQSMELDDKLINAHWTKDENGKLQFFIINEAVISKLCILGEDYEPCFEGAQIYNDTENLTFSFEEDFKQKLFSMISELKDLLKDKGGENPVFTTYAVEIGGQLWDLIYNYLVDTYPDTKVEWPDTIYLIEGIFENEDKTKFIILKNRQENTLFQLNFEYDDTNGFVPSTDLIEVTKTYVPAEKPQFSLEDINSYRENRKMEFAKKEEPEVCPECGKPVEECECEKNKDKTKKYNLDEIPEYMELNKNYSLLQEQYEALKEEIQGLKEFKLAVEKKEKEAMIESFYMLSDDDKKDVIENIDSYSLNDIEAKLSILCVRNKVSFDLGNNDNKDDGAFTYSINSNLSNDDAPAWVKAMRSVAKDM